MAFTLSGPVGKVPAVFGKSNAPAHANKAIDILPVQRMLNKMACVPRLPEDGKLSDGLIAAIEDFQSSWTTPDGRIDPGGTTIHRLDFLANGTYTIKQVKDKKLERGGYHIGYGPSYKWTQKYRTYLGLRSSSLSPGDDLRRLGPLTSCIDISEKGASDVLDYATLPSFLKAIEEFGDSAWGNDRYCAIYIARDGIIVSRSRNAVPIKCPVKPLTGKPAIVMPENLPYVHEGALVTPTPINDKYWFRYGGHFCTKNASRGLNCCTYPAAVYGLIAHTGDGASIADAIAPGTNAVNGESYAKMMTYLTSHRTGTYLMWYDFSKGGHVVLVVDGVGHEWSESKPGYKVTTIASSYDDKTDACIWGSKVNGKYWVRRLSA